jgi:hypothetical protein
LLKLIGVGLDDRVLALEDLDRTPRLKVLTDLLRELTTRQHALETPRHGLDRSKGIVDLVREHPDDAFPCLRLFLA